MSETRRLTDHGDRARLPGVDWPWLSQFRRRAQEAFSRQGLPTTRQEAWKYSDLGNLDECVFHIDGSAAQAGSGSIRAERGEAYAETFGGDDLSRALTTDSCYLVFQGGRFAATQSRIAELPAGARLLPMRQALLEERPLIEAYLGRLAIQQAQPFAALNSAWICDGMLLYLPAGCRMPAPVHCHFESPGEGQAQACFPRLLVIVEAGAQATLVETYAGSASGSGHLTDALCEIWLGESATLLHGKHLTECCGNRHIAATLVAQAGGSHYHACLLAHGSGWCRNDLQVQLRGEGAYCELDGLYLLSGKQHLDNHLCIEHQAPGCRSDLLYKGMLYDRARGVFNGQAVVHPDAQRSDARQVNKNLLLSLGAEMNTKPELQIEADDVQCSHGATVGYLDQDALFYLNSRGIGLDAARALLVMAFAGEVLERLPAGPMQAWMQRAFFEAVSARDDCDLDPQLIDSAHAGACSRDGVTAGEQA